MNMLTRALPFLILCIGLISTAEDIQRFPPPEFESGYKLPVAATPPPRAEILNTLDVAVLIGILSVAAYLALKKRRRKDIFILMIFSLLYFGFYRKGCICPIGSIQNVSLAFFNHTYAIPVTVLIFFLLPLIYALFFGRVFCAAVCPLGAIQDLMLIKPVKVPAWLQHTLGLLAYVYLGAAVLFAATGSAFIICQYDPFVSFFRVTGNFFIISVGIILLALGMFVGRPYCLFLCPYGAILRILSYVSQWRVTITPDLCIQCRICEEVCPYGAISAPTPKNIPEPEPQDRRRLFILLVLAPVIIALSAWIFSFTAAPFSRMHFTVRLAEQVVIENSHPGMEYSEASKAFRDSGQSVDILIKEALAVKRQFSLGVWILGAFIGLVIACKLISLSLFKKRTEYEIDPGGCLACGRCFIYCPIEIKRQNKLRSASTASENCAVTEK